MSCDEEQKEEIEAIECMFDQSEWKVIDSALGEYEYHYVNERGNAILKIKLTTMYPKSASPIFSISDLRSVNVQNIENKLKYLCSNNYGRPILFEMLSEFKAYLDELFATESKSIEEVNADLIDHVEQQQPTFDIVHGDPVMDKKSVFQAHAVKVESREDVKSALELLLDDKKVAAATHNIYAYRIEKGNGCFIEDCEDDGETAAGTRMAHLLSLSIFSIQSIHIAINHLQVMNVKNVLVVVSRWYGGIKLGPDRFKHINNCVRNILVENQFHQIREHESKKNNKK